MTSYGGARRLILLAAVSATICGCARHFPAVAGRTVYACCNLFFNNEGDATDANYQYAASTKLAVGTPVAIADDGARWVEVHPLDGRRSFKLIFKFGAGHTTPDAYFRRVFVDEDPTSQVAKATPEIAAAIREARLVTGMTKEQALLARGYPPPHRTPDLAADRWMYYASPGAVELVDFAGGRITAITPAAAP